MLGDVWIDSNGDGTRDADERGVAGARCISSGRTRDHRLGGRVLDSARVRRPARGSPRRPITPRRPDLCRTALGPRRRAARKRTGCAPDRAGTRARRVPVARDSAGADRALGAGVGRGEGQRHPAHLALRPALALERRVRIREVVVARGGRQPAHARGEFPRGQSRLAGAGRGEHRQRADSHGAVPVEPGTLRGAGQRRARCVDRDGRCARACRRGGIRRRPTGREQLDRRRSTPQSARRRELHSAGTYGR